VAKPGFTAPRWEKEVYTATVGGEAFRLPQLASAYPAEAPLIATLDGLSALAAGQHLAALSALQWSWASGLAVENHPFVQRYLWGTTVTVQIATGVTAVMPLCRDVVGLALAELLQEAGQIPAAIDVVESLEPSAIAAVSLAELYLEGNRPADVVQLTNGLSNDDEPTALLLTFRGTALSQLGQPGAAREALKAALTPRSRSAEIRHLAFLARASTYLAEGKKALAKKDLERVLAEDANFPGLDQALAQLDAG
jgi:tetratricopeptide (TPR) repeat protein